MQLWRNTALLFVFVYQKMKNPVRIAAKGQPNQDFAAITAPCVNLRFMQW